LVVCREDNGRADEHHRSNLSSHARELSVCRICTLRRRASAHLKTAEHVAERKNCVVPITSFSFTRAAFSRRQWVGVSNCSRPPVSTTLHGVRRKLVFAHFVYPFVRGPSVLARSSGPFSRSSAVCVMIALNGSIIFQRLPRTYDTVREEATGMWY